MRTLRFPANPLIPFVGHVGADSYISLFTLESLGISTGAFVRRFADSFHHLKWDDYDVRKRQIALLKGYGLPMDEHSELFKKFYLGDTLLFDKFCRSLTLLTADQLAVIQSVKAYRRRAVGYCHLIFDDDEGWTIATLPHEAYRQRGGNNAFLSYPRSFLPMAPWILKDQYFQHLLVGVANRVEHVAGPVKSMRIAIHQVMCVATAKYCGDNAPEGVHQDGADYIVSALLVDKKNIEGGVSRITDSTNETSFLVHQLRPGEGVFQSDKDSELWHDVSKIYHKVESDSKLDYGYRSTFGLDIWID